MALRAGLPGGEQRVTDKGIVPLFILILLSLFLYSCEKSDEPDTAQKMVKTLKRSLYKVELSPSYATRESTITATVKGAKSSDVSYQWMVNGEDIEKAREKTFSYPDLSKYDEVAVRITVKGRGQMVSDPLVIANIIPIIRSANLIPRNPKIRDELAIEVKTEDGDNDNVSLSYEWFVNDKTTDRSDSTLDLKDISVRRGDKVSITITPEDNDQQGQSITVKTLIANSPPDVSLDFKAEMDGFKYTSRIIAQDPDGDPLTFVLNDGPDGMAIDSWTGVVTWEVKPEQGGSHDVSVLVKDGHNGESLVKYVARIGIKPVNEKQVPNE
jgi:hypothetical protein